MNAVDFCDRHFAALVVLILGAIALFKGESFLVFIACLLLWEILTK